MNGIISCRNAIFVFVLTWIFCKNSRKCSNGFHHNSYSTTYNWREIWLHSPLFHFINYPNSQQRGRGLFLLPLTLQGVSNFGYKVHKNTFFVKNLYFSLHPEISGVAVLPAVIISQNDVPVLYFISTMTHSLCSLIGYPLKMYFWIYMCSFDYELLPSLAM